MKVELNRGAVRELLRSDKVADDLHARAERVAAAAGDGMEAEVEIQKNRARASVVTATPDAMRAEARGRDLTRAFSAARG